MIRPNSFTKRHSGPLYRWGYTADQQRSADHRLKNNNLKPIASHFKLFSIPVQPTDNTCVIFYQQSAETKGRLHYITKKRNVTPRSIKVMRHIIPDQTLYEEITHISGFFYVCTRFSKLLTSTAAATLPCRASM